MPQSPYREPFKLDSSISVSVETEVAECLKVMAETTKIPEGELVNTAMRRFISTHSDYFPKGFWAAKKKSMK